MGAPMRLMIGVGARDSLFRHWQATEQRLPDTTAVDGAINTEGACGFRRRVGPRCDASLGIRARL